MNNPPILHPAPIAPAAPGRPWLQVPSSVGQVLIQMSIGWVGMGVVALVLSLISTLAGIAALLIFLAATGAVLHQAWNLLRARQRVLSQKDVPIVWGLGRLIAWDPVEGVLFLKNKKLTHCDDRLDDDGGVRMIYPILGEELALRVPLEVQTLRFADEKVLTREYLSVTVRGSVKWRIVDLRQFYLFVSRELRITWDHENHTHQARQPVSGRNDPVPGIGGMLGLAIEWLRMLAEEQTRLVMSRLSSGLLLADRLSAEVPEVKEAARAETRANVGSSVGSSPALLASPEWTSGADSLGRRIYEQIAARVAPYGIGIEDVSLQEIRLPEEIVQQCIRACKAAYLPLIGKREAAERSADLAAEVELLGRQLVGTREVVGAAPPIALIDFLGQFLAKNIADPNGIGLAAAATGALVAAPIAAAAIQSQPTHA